VLSYGMSSFLHDLLLLFLDCGPQARAELTKGVGFHEGAVSSEQ
jgi:hypothetical protein